MKEVRDRGRKKIAVEATKAVSRRKTIRLKYSKKSSVAVSSCA